MKVLAAFFILFLLWGCENSTIVVAGNTEKKPIDFEKGKVRCSECQMVIPDYKFSAQVVTPEGKTYFFSDVGSFVKWNKTKPFRDLSVIWVYSNDTNRWIDAKKAFYSLDDITPMKYGFGAYETELKGFVEYETMKAMMLRGENMTNPAYRKRVLEKTN